MSKLTNELWLCTLDSNHRMFEIARISATIHRIVYQYCNESYRLNNLNEKYNEDLELKMFNEWLKSEHDR